MKKIFLLIPLILCHFLTVAQKTDHSLERKIKKLTEDFNGDVGIYVKNLKTGKIACLNAESIYPTASMIKVPIMCAVCNEIEKGNLNYHQELTYRDSLLYPGDDILGSFKDGARISLGEVQLLSITTSDNTASLWLQKIVGGDQINSWLKSNGFKITRINSRTAGRENFYQKYGWGMTTPREMAQLFIKVRKGEAVNGAASERMYRNLVRIYWDGEALSQIPPYVQAISKQGAVNESRSETVLVNAPHGDYVFCIITNHQKDQSWDYENEGFVLIRNLSKLLWHYFEPKSGWKPASGIKKYR